MRVIDLALKDLTQLVRDWKAAVFLVVMPVLFTFMFGFVFSGDSDIDPRLPVGFLDEDGGSASLHLETLMEASAVIRPVRDEVDLDEADEKVKDADWTAAVFVPPGYEESLWTENHVALTVIVDQGDLSGSTAQREIETVVTRLMGAVKAAELSTASYAEQASLSTEALHRYRNESLNRAVTAWSNPPLTVQVSYSTAESESEDGQEAVFGDNPYSHSSAGMMVQFAMAGLIGAAEIMVLERKSRSLARLLTTAISRIEIILGHFLAMFVMLLVQFLLLTVFGHLILGVQYYSEPTATLLLIVTLALWVASLGLLIGTLARREEQVVIFSLIPMFLLSALGGAWMPLEFTPEGFQTVGHFTPTAWAIDGFKNVIIRGLGIESSLVPAAILVSYAIVCFAVAVWRFRSE
jgi:ABC-2 type transport system permease protein